MAVRIAPRLGYPAADSFRFWVMLDAANVLTLEYRIWGSGAAWTLADTVTADATKEWTAVLTASGLSAATRYEWRISESAVQIATNSTWTMPTGDGRFIVYQISDGHSGAWGQTNETTYAEALRDWETNYEPLGIPAFIIQYGDFIAYEGPVEDQIPNHLIPDFTEVTTPLSRLPWCYMWDDWDWAGDNSCKDYSDAADFTTMPDDAEWLADIMWRDSPRHASPSWGYEINVCNVPFLIIDSRSQRLFGLPQRIRTGGDVTNLDIPTWNGLEDPLTSGFKLYGAIQAAWIRDRLTTYSDRGLIILVHPDTVSDIQAPGPNIFNNNLADGDGAGARDSTGLFYRAERNYVLEPILSYGMSISRTVQVWSGDDHVSRVLDVNLGAVKNLVGRDVIRDAEWTANSNGDLGWSRVISADYNGPAQKSGIRIREFKVSPGVTGATQGSHIFRGGQIYDNRPDGVNSTTSAVKVMGRWDITSARGGTDVTARIAYHGVSTRAVVDDALGRTGEWYYHNGRLVPFTDTAGSQTYPPENSATSGITFERTYVDDTLGMGHREGDIVRDQWGAIRRTDDVDTEGRDETLHQHTPRAEREDVLE